jgi:hypothetical protein
LPKNLFNSGVDFRECAKVTVSAVKCRLVIERQARMTAATQNSIWWRSEYLATPTGSKTKPTLRLPSRTSIFTLSLTTEAHRAPFLIASSKVSDDANT